MQKRNLPLAFLMSLISMGFVSAQFYGPFSIGSLLSSIDPSTLILSVTFLIFFLVINFALSKYFKENRSISALISLSISLMIIYGINRSGFNYSAIFYSLGLSNDTLLPVTYIIFWIALIYVLWKFIWYKVFFSLSGLMFLIFAASYIVPGLTNTGWFLIAGIVFGVIGFFFWRLKVGKAKKDWKEKGIVIRSG